MRTDQSGNILIPLRDLEVERFYKLRDPVILVPIMTLLTQNQAHFDSLHTQFHELLFKSDLQSNPTGDPIFQFQPTIGDEADAFLWFDPNSFPNGLDTEFILYVPAAAPPSTRVFNAPRTRKGGRLQRYKKKRHSTNTKGKKRHAKK